MVGGPTCLNPRGTLCKILMGYLPAAVLRCRQYSQDAMVRTMITKALRKVERKKNKRFLRGYLRPSQSHVIRIAYKLKRPVIPKAASSLVFGKNLNELMMTL